MRVSRKREQMHVREEGISHTKQYSERKGMEGKPPQRGASSSSRSQKLDNILELHILDIANQNSHLRAFCGFGEETGLAEEVLRFVFSVPAVVE